MRSLVFIVAVSTFTVFAASSAFAQRAVYNADPAIAGNTYRPFSGRAYSKHAINHAQILQHYATDRTSISADTAKEHAAEVRRNLDAFGKEIAKLPKEFEKDPDAAKLIAEIREHQAEALKHCGMLEEECAKHAAAGGTVMQCCTDMLKHMRAADQAHDKLMTHLGIQLPIGGAKKK
jgi:hypothetical protein